MKPVLEVIQERREKHESNHYIAWLREQTHNKASIERVYEIALIVAHFHLSFTDVNRLAWYYPNPTDNYTKAINLHADEDGTHFKLLIQDLKTLGCNTRLSATDLLSFMWSPQNTASRDLTFALYELGKKCQQPAIKFAMIESLEQHGNIMFTAYFNLIKSIAENHQDYVFFGEKHLLLEQGHLVNQEINEHELFNALILNDAELNEAISAVHATWDVFETWQVGIMNTLPHFAQIFAQAIAIHA